jgi:hypothetical protein
MKAESGWLIEFPWKDGGVRWWHPHEGWISDRSKALRFARQQDAEDFMEGSMRAELGSLLKATKYETPALRYDKTRRTIVKSDDGESAA